ncbi:MULTISPECIES: 3D domain-containing protein [Oscillospiraceae]|jgi:3D (Asp-Asp-Asp) domain-containing protein|uniref:3D domain-containing protein n=1 Tax=Oscillospiraceae TaxID=216572 RepID=UPI0003AD7AB1|nr:MULTISPECIES: 3D domain-containing protein [Oscillospiraceae]ERK62970.1 3D domain protein [Oscillibacter sp. KLE 1745]ERK65040.1 3D domain protein [Oscillibacter sp. KLE 1728]
MKKLTREERRHRSQRRLQLITYLLFLLLLLAWLGSYLIMTVEAEPPALRKMALTTEGGSLPGDDTPATTRCYLTGEEMEAAENELIEAALLARSHRLEDVTITFYCCEGRPHICGTGTGITASGRRVTPYVSCAVDTDIIPLGSTIMIEHNGGMVYLRADDTGPAVKGDHIDIAVKGHLEALSLGVQTADIWWCEEGE